MQIQSIRIPSNCMRLLSTPSCRDRIDLAPEAIDTSEWPVIRNSVPNVKRKLLADCFVLFSIGFLTRNQKLRDRAIGRLALWPLDRGIFHGHGLSRRLQLNLK